MTKKLYYVNDSDYFWMTEEEAETLEKYLRLASVFCDIEEMEVKDFAEELRNA